jgi:hypothetical protein
MEYEDRFILKDFFYHLKILYLTLMTYFLNLKFQMFLYLIIFRDYDVHQQPNYYKIQYALFYLVFPNQFPLRMDVIEVQAMLSAHLEPYSADLVEKI